LTAKTATSFLEIVSISVILSYVSARNYSLNRFLWCCFSLISSWFERCLQKTTRLNYSKRFGIFSKFCVHDLINFPFNLRHTKTIKILMCEDDDKPEIESEPWKKRAPELHSWKPRAPELTPCSWKELRRRSCVLYPKVPQPWKNPHCSRSRVKSTETIQSENSTEKLL